jgi:hypothetical protein
MYAAESLTTRQPISKEAVIAKGRIVIEGDGSAAVRMTADDE